MQVEKSEELKYLLQVFAQKDDIWRQEVWPLKIVVDGPKTSRAETQKILTSKRENETKTDLQLELRAKGKRKEKANKLQQKQLRESRLHPLDHWRPAFIWRGISRSSVTRTTNAKGRDDLVHFLLQFHTPKLTGQSPSREANGRHCTNFKKRKLPK